MSVSCTGIKRGKKQVADTERLWVKLGWWLILHRNRLFCKAKKAVHNAGSNSKCVLPTLF